MSKETKWKLFALVPVGGLVVYFGWTAYMSRGSTQWLAFTFLLFTIYSLSYNFTFGWKGNSDNKDDQLSPPM